MARVTVELNGAVQTIYLQPKTFKTGSKGFHGFGKLEDGRGTRYQLNVMAVEIGSKGNHKRKVA